MKMKSLHRIPTSSILLLNFTGIAQSFILGFQLSSEPTMELTTYPYPDRNSSPVDLANCQEGPGGEVLAVGVINGVSQGIATNTRQKMKGIALWREPGCSTGKPDYIISWREGVQGMQLADMALAGQIINVRSWMDLEEDNIHLRKLGKPFGYIYKFESNTGAGINIDDGGDGDDDYDEGGEMIDVEEGMPVVVVGKRKTTAAAKLELIKRAGTIREAFLTVDELDESQSHGTSPNTDTDTDARQPTIQGILSGNAGPGWPYQPQPQAQPGARYNQNTPRPGGNMMMNPFPSINNLITPSTQPYDPQNMMSSPFARFSQNINTRAQQLVPQNNLVFVYPPIYIYGPPPTQLLQQSYASNPYIYPQQLQGTPNINTNRNNYQNTQPRLPTDLPNQDYLQQGRPSGTGNPLEDAISDFGYELGLVNPMAPVEEVEKRTQALNQYLSNNDETIIPNIVNDWPTVRMETSGIPPTLLEDIQGEGGELLKKEEEEVEVGGGGGEQPEPVNEEIVEEIQTSRGDPMQEFRFGTGYYDNMHVSDNPWDPRPFGSLPYAYQAGRQSLAMPEPVYQNPYYNLQAPQGQQLPQAWGPGSQLGSLGIPENYPRMLSEIYNARAYGDQPDDQGIGTQSAGYSQYLPHSIDEIVPNDQNQDMQFEQRARELVNNENLRNGGEAASEDRSFEEEYSPIDDGDFFADDENFSGNTQLSEF
ncbi:hypothetical protein TWF718_000995 [Orbilia javanica]|uniref:Uncharacterized protein n=1 Tax=Orbilia javanica TaxID=47235 RepID=A0AAN8RGX2_9PEZI